MSTPQDVIAEPIRKLWEDAAEVTVAETVDGVLRALNRAGYIVIHANEFIEAINQAAHEAAAQVVTR